MSNEHSDTPREAQPARPALRPNQDQERQPVEGRPPEEGVGREPRGVQHGIADADDAARAAAGRKEDVRNTPPAGDWNDTAPD